MKLAKPIAKLIESFERLPGIGPKTAQRLTFYLLHVPQFELDNFAQNLSDLKKKTKICSICFNVEETDPCSICQDLNRDESIICVVEQPLDVLAFERTGKYKGVYHVLHGVIDPLNNIGPDELYISSLLKRIENKKISEIILATNPTMEGEATAMYIANKVKSQKSKLKSNIKITRIARGLPTGSDIEYADQITLQKAVEGRNHY